MALTIAQKSDVRRHLEYPVAGLARMSPSGGTLASGAIGYRFFQAYGFLEYKLNNLMPDEESRLTGSAYGAVAIVGVAPNINDTVSVVISNGAEFAAQTLTSTVLAGWSGLSIAADLARLAAQNSVLTSAGFVPLAPFGTGPFSGTTNPAQSVNTPIAQVAFVRPATFTITASAVGAMGASVTNDGSKIEPRSVVDVSTIPETVLFGYLPILNYLEGAIMGSTQNLDTAKADVWTARPTEIQERTTLYKRMQGMLANFLGTPINQERRRMSMAMV